MKNKNEQEYNELTKVYPLVPETDCHSTDDYWKNEFIMRDMAMDVIREITNDQTVILSEDLDEIVKPEVVK